MARDFSKAQVIMLNNTPTCIVDGTVSFARTTLAKMRHAGHQDGFAHLTKQQYLGSYYWHLVTVPIIREIKK